MTPFLVFLVMAALQGLTEYLPVSSSGHLVLAREFLPGGQSLPNDASVEVVLHLGTLFAVLLFYRREIGALLAGLLGRRDDSSGQRRLLGLLFLGTVPAGVVGVLFESRIEEAFSGTLLASTCLLLTGLLLFSVRKLEKRPPESTSSPGDDGLLHISFSVAMLIGCAQAFAILPGISRSGTTIVVGLFLGLRNRDAAAFSFLLSIPAILGAVVLKLPEITAGAGPLNGVQLASGAAASFVIGYLALGMLLWLMRARRLSWFAPYCWALGILGLALTSTT